MSTEQARPDAGIESGPLIPMSLPGARQAAGWLFWIIFPLLSLTAIVFVIVSIATHAGKKPDGIIGNLQNARRTCSNKICTVRGNFVSDDGALKVSNVIADPRWHADEVHRVLYDLKNPVVVVAGPGHWDPTTAVIAGLGGLTYLGAVGYFVRAARREPQH
jgi:hypothetical protein